MTLKVRDPLKRKWDRGVYMGPNSTNPEAVRKAREEALRQQRVAQGVAAGL
jgi:hypothetical protein